MDQIPAQMLADAYYVIKRLHMLPEHFIVDPGEHRLDARSLSPGVMIREDFLAFVSSQVLVIRRRPSVIVIDHVRIQIIQSLEYVLR
ncbi:hypothetical protein SDC9_163624 [bioreactor metagenome]|uniref:Uncharacterized protein n=1 Tax=bioreactor metagenome TaxID=1076179 RepID=A0A645FRD8_9ZZZZ